MGTEVYTYTFFQNSYEDAGVLVSFSDIKLPIKVGVPIDDLFSQSSTPSTAAFFGYSYAK